MISAYMSFFSLFQRGKKVEKRIYLDHAAATPLLPEVVKVMRDIDSKTYGNPSAIHQEGVLSRNLIEKARTDIAKVLEIPREGVIFTSGGTESNNLAIMGYVARLLQEGLVYTDMEIISTAIEHPATRNTLVHLKQLGVIVHEVAVDGVGRIDQVALRNLVSAKTVLITVAYVNSEIGTIEEVGAIGRIVTAARANSAPNVLFHVDAAQAPLWLSCVMPHLKIDMLSLDAGKCGGPKAMGVLAIRKGVSIAPVAFGGAQERGLRPGTESVSLIVGGVTAIIAAQTGWRTRAVAVQKIRDAALATIAEQLPQAIVNGAVGDARVANNINISIPGIDSEFAVVVLDTKGIAASTKSACSSAGSSGSIVVKAVSGDDARAQSTIRLTLGARTTLADVTKAIEILSEHVAKQRF